MKPKCVLCAVRDLYLYVSTLLIPVLLCLPQLYGNYSLTAYILVVSINPVI